MLQIRPKQEKQISLWEGIFPKGVLELSEELKKIDQLLDDERFYEPFTKQFSKIGRPTVPISIYLRMMYIKYRYDLGYETLVEEVADSLKWRKFCGFKPQDKVPDSTTLIKLTHKIGSEVVEEINNILVKKAKEQKIIRGKKMRADTTVVESNIHYPTDLGLIADSIRVITRTVKRIKSLGGATRTYFRDRSRVVKKIILRVVKVLKKRSGEAKQEITEQTQKLIKVLDKVQEQGEKVLRNTARRAKSISPDVFSHIKRSRKQLDRLLHLSTLIKQQTQKVLSGQKSIPHRIVSIFDPNARPIRKGKLSKDTEFGRKVTIQEVENGIISGYKVHEGNPGDSTLFKETITRHVETFGKSPYEVAFDRGYYERGNEEWAREQGVEKICIPKPGKKTEERKEYEKQYWFKRLNRFRAGSEAKISLLKRKYGLDRSMIRGTEGTGIWIGYGVMSANLWQIARVN